MSPRDSKQFPKDNRDNDENLPGQSPSEYSGGEDGNSDGNSGSGSSSEDDMNENDNEDGPGLESGDRLGQLRRLRREHRILLRERAREERLLAQEIALRDQTAREVEIMELRAQELRRQKIADLAELRALETESSDGDDQEEAESPASKNEHTSIDVTGAKADGMTENGRSEEDE